PLLPLELSADAPPLASQLPPGCGRLYFFISELENTDAPMRKVMTDGSGIITISIPLLSVRLLGVIRKIPFSKLLTTADVLKLCSGAFSVDFSIHFSIERASEEHLSTATSSETPPSFNQIECWTGDVLVQAELSYKGCWSYFEVRHASNSTRCHTCENDLLDKSFFWCCCCDRVICVQCMESMIH
ncbi:GPI-anchored surface protein, putative, partial [Bodo saltans]